MIWAIFCGLVAAEELRLQRVHSTPRFRTLDATVPMNNYYTVMYTAEVHIGSPPRPYRLIFDTGSADLWLFSSRTSSQQPWIRYYDSDASSSFHPKPDRCAIEYGLGSINGSMAQEQVTLAGLAAVQTLTVAEQWTHNFEVEREPMDGILGLAFRDVACSEAPTIMDALMEAKQIESRVFAFVLADDIGEEGSLFILGEPNPDLYEGQMQYFPLLPQHAGMWLVQMDSITAQNINFACPIGCAALIDTGTSFIGLPSALYLQVLETIQSKRPDCVAKQGENVFCSQRTLFGLPTITFTFHGIPYAVTPSDYMVTNVVGIMAVDVRSTVPIIILGDVFMKRYVTVFDMDRQRIGFGQIKEDRLIHTLRIAVGAFVILMLVGIPAFLTRSRWTTCVKKWRSPPTAGQFEVVTDDEFDSFTDPSHHHRPTPNHQ